jgi:hypothetical protein
MILLNNYFSLFSCFILLLAIILLVLNFKEGNLFFVPPILLLVELLIWTAFMTQLSKVSADAIFKINLICCISLTPFTILFLSYFSKNKMFIISLVLLSIIFLSINIWIGISFKGGLMHHFKIILIQLLIPIGICLHYLSKELDINTSRKINLAKIIFIGTILFAYLCFLMILGLVNFLKIYFQEEVYFIFILLINLVAIAIVSANIILMYRKHYKKTEETRIGIYEEEIAYL